MNTWIAVITLIIPWMKLDRSVCATTLEYYIIATQFTDYSSTDSYTTNVAMLVASNVVNQEMRS